MEPLIMTYDEREIYRDDDRQLVILRIGTTSQRFNDILNLRAEDTLRSDPEDGLLPVPPTDGIDGYSEQYCAYVEGRPVASVRVTRGEAGPADCEEFYPPGLMEHFRPITVSCSRLIRTKNWTGGRWLVRMMLQALYRHYLPMGFRLIVITCRRRMIPYYEQAGLRLVRDSYFLNPHRGSPNHVMLMVADGQGPNVFGEEVDWPADNHTLADLHEVVHLYPDRHCRYREENGLAAA
jgi:hypothetical protein